MSLAGEKQRGKHGPSGGSAGLQWPVQREVCQLVGLRPGETGEAASTCPVWDAATQFPEEFC